MFKTRTIVALGVFAAVLVAVLVAHSRKDLHLRSEPAPGKAPAGAPAKLVAADIDGLEIAAPGKPKVVLKKDGAAWKVVEPAADAADQNSIDQALKSLTDVEFKDVVAESKDSYERLQIRDEDVIRVTASKAGKPLVALAIGKSGLVRVGDDKSVWSVAKLNRFAFEKDAKMWRNREIVRFEKDQVERVESTMDGQKIVVKRIAPPPPPPTPDGGPPPMPAPEHYQLVEGQAFVGGALDETVPTNVLAGLGQLDIAEFADGVTADAAGLSPPRSQIEVDLSGGGKKALEIGKEDGEFTFARVDGRIFKLRKSTADGFVRPSLQWRDKQLAKLDAKDVAKIDIVKGQDHVVLERVDDATWKMSEPKQPDDFDSARAQSEAQVFTNLRGTQISALTAKDAKTGLAKPTAVVKVWKKGASAPAVTVTVGALDGKAYYLQVSGRPEVFTAADAGVNRWLKTASDFKKPAGGDGPPGGMPPGMMGMPPGMRMPAGHP